MDEDASGSGTPRFLLALLCALLLRCQLEEGIIESLQNVISELASGVKIRGSQNIPSIFLKLYTCQTFENMRKAVSLCTNFLTNFLENTKKEHS